jgi:hypothetical protein
VVLAAEVVLAVGIVMVESRIGEVLLLVDLVDLVLVEVGADLRVERFLVVEESFLWVELVGGVLGLVGFVMVAKAEEAVVDLVLLVDKFKQKIVGARFCELERKRVFLILGVFLLVRVCACGACVCVAGVCGSSCRICV